ncbi:M20/M25/M40 family metallo-hydrolase [Archangium violaceum]|uniref:M20/M25/M40 family metallo-hydrolase n=1 Tax=Archangium violaceum TaxID=83451 RepID=UPI001951886A|nr:M20/M25/M40 family metallo-hydrolase [Archangium violaceum]QRN98126.1 M20/M25/M40 family metallo-hydrolase [Archangium violaceum]
MRVPMFLPALLTVALASSCDSSTPPALDEARLAGLPELATSVDTARLMATVNAVVAAHRSDTPMDCARLGVTPPSPSNPLCHLTREKARAYLRNQLAALGLTLTEHVSRDGDLDVVNVVAEKRGTRSPHEVVLVGAHYDALHAGADDNATGVAAVLELARVLSTRSFDRTVRFVGFDLEELGSVGSTRYVADLARDEHIVVALVLDSIGYRSTSPGSQRSVPPLSFPTTGDFILALANSPASQQLDELWQLHQRMDLTRMMTLGAPGNGNGPLTGDLLRSDHAPFWLDGTPALLLNDSTDLRSPHYHQRTDTPETLDPAFFSDVVRLSAVSLAYWAGGVR